MAQKHEYELFTSTSNESTSPEELSQISTFNRCQPVLGPFGT
jgi:hypothetical protein